MFLYKWTEYFYGVEIRKKCRLALIQAVFHVSGRFWAQENQRPKNQKATFFQDMLYSLKTHPHYLTVFIYLATWRTTKLDIFLHLTFTNLPWCSQNRNPLIHVYSVEIPSCFLWVITVVITLLRITSNQNFFSVLPPRRSGCFLNQ